MLATNQNKNPHKKHLFLVFLLLLWISDGNKNFIILVRDNLLKVNEHMARINWRCLISLNFQIVAFNFYLNDRMNDYIYFENMYLFICDIS